MSDTNISIEMEKNIILSLYYMYKKDIPDDEIFELDDTTRIYIKRRDIKERFRLISLYTTCLNLPDISGKMKDNLEYQIIEKYTDMRKEKGKEKFIEYINSLVVHKGGK